MPIVCLTGKLTELGFGHGVSSCYTAAALDEIGLELEAYKRGPVNALINVKKNLREKYIYQRQS